MNIARTAFIILAIIALMIPAVDAELVVNKYTNDFVLSSPNNEQIKICSCETRVDKLIVENTGEFYSDYSIEVHSDYPGKIRLSESIFPLPPKHFKEVLVYIEDSCGVQGDFGYLVTAVSSYGRVEQLDRRIRADVCQVALLEVAPAERTVGLCQPATFTTTVTNVGTFADSFSLDFGRFNDVAEIETPDVFLQPGESHTQNVSFTWHCAEYGEKMVDFLLYTGKYGFQVQMQRPVTITNDYNFGLGLKTDMDACADATTHIPLSVENAVNAPGEVRLVLNAPSFVTFENGDRSVQVRLAPDAVTDVDLKVSPERSRIGEHTISVTATDLYGGVRKVRDAALSVDNCYDPAVELRVTPTDVLEGTDVDCCGQKTYYVNVQNLAEREQTFQIVLDGPSMFTLDESTVRLQPSQNVNVPLRAALPCTDEVYSADVIVHPVGQPQINVTDSITVESFTQRTCYMIHIDDDEIVVRDDAEVVPVIVTHTGIKGGNYTVTSDSTLFTFREETIELVPGEQKAIHMIPSVDLAEQEKGRYLVFPDLTLNTQSIAYNEFVGVHLRSKGLIERFFDWLFSLSLAGLGFCVKLILLLFLILLVLGLLLLFVYGGGITLFSDGLLRSTMTILKTILLVLLVVLVLSIALSDVPGRDTQYERIAEGMNATVLEWYQNERLTVNLNDYFDDPDKDNLVYEATQPRDVQAEIDGYTLTLTPDHNFAGENTLMVTASDEKGGVADSPLFILNVIPEKDLSFIEWLQIWCRHVVLLLLIAIVLVLFLGVLTIRERRQDLRGDNVLVVVPEEASTVSALKRRAKTRYYASKTGTKVHKLGCMALKNVAKKDRVSYKSKTAVLNAGLALCSICDEKAAKAGDVRKKAVAKKSKASRERAERRAKRKKTARKKARKKVARKVSKKSKRKKTSRKTLKKATRKRKKR